MRVGSWGQQGGLRQPPPNEREASPRWGRRPPEAGGVPGRRQGRAGAWREQVAGGGRERRAPRGSQGGRTPGRQPLPTPRGRGHAGESAALHRLRSDPCPRRRPPRPRRAPARRRWGPLHRTRLRRGWPQPDRTQVTGVKAGQGRAAVLLPSQRLWFQAGLLVSVWDPGGEGVSTLARALSLGRSPDLAALPCKRGGECGLLGRDAQGGPLHWVLCLLGVLPPEGCLWVNVYLVTVTLLAFGSSQ